MHLGQRDPQRAPSAIEGDGVRAAPQRDAADELEVVEAPLPAAGRGEVRVRVLASSVEYTDVTIRRHLYPWVFRRPPFVMGYDVVGEIDQLGDGVSGLQLGDRVADMTVIGCPAGKVAVQAAALPFFSASGRADKPRLFSQRSTSASSPI